MIGTRSAASSINWSTSSIWWSATFIISTVSISWRWSFIFAYEIWNYSIFCSTKRILNKQFLPVDRPRSRLSGVLCLGERLSIGDRLRSPERDLRLGGGESMRLSRFLRSFSFIICSKAASGSSIIPVPILLATPWKAVATKLDSISYKRKRYKWNIQCIAC